MKMRSLRTVLVGGMVLWLCAETPPVYGHTAAEEMADAARNFLAALTPEQRARTTFELKDPERRNWHFVPRPRRGLPFKDMTSEQRHLAHALLNSGLSQRGYGKAVTIMSLEQILRELEGDGRSFEREPELYFVSIFGAPDSATAWGWRVEGHHLSVNITLGPDGTIAAAPAFFGSNPAEVKQGSRRGLRVLHAEEDLGRQLVQSLSGEQRRAALVAEVAYKDILTGAAPRVKALEPAGLPAAQMAPEQQQVLRQLVEEYARRYRPEIAEHDLAAIQKAGWERVTFAWAGSTQRGKGHYYRVQGPTFLLEYDNTQNDNNHVHSVWRDFANDFGEDVLRRHYTETPHAN